MKYDERKVLMDKVRKDTRLNIKSILNPHDIIDLYADYVNAVEALKKMDRILFPVSLSIAEQEAIDGPIKDDAPVLSFSGSGASDIVTYKEFKEALLLTANVLAEFEKPKDIKEDVVDDVIDLDSDSKSTFNTILGKAIELYGSTPNPSPKVKPNISIQGEYDKEKFGNIKFDFKGNGHPKPYSTICLFHRQIDGEDVFYSVTVVCATPTLGNLIAHVHNHVALNPGTLKVESVYGGVLYPYTLLETVKD